MTLVLSFALDVFTLLACFVGLITDATQGSAAPGSVELVQLADWGLLAGLVLGPLRPLRLLAPAPASLTGSWEPFLHEASRRLLQLSALTIVFLYLPLLFLAPVFSPRVFLLMAVRALLTATCALVVTLSVPWQALGRLVDEEHQALLQAAPSVRRRPVPRQWPWASLTWRELLHRAGVPGVVLLAVLGAWLVARFWPTSQTSVVPKGRGERMVKLSDAVPVSGSEVVVIPLPIPQKTTESEPVVPPVRAPPIDPRIAPQGNAAAAAPQFVLEPSLRGVSGFVEGGLADRILDRLGPCLRDAVQVGRLFDVTFFIQVSVSRGAMVATGSSVQPRLPMPALADLAATKAALRRCAPLVSTVSLRETRVSASFSFAVEARAQPGAIDDFVAPGERGFVPKVSPLETGHDGI